MDDPPGTPDPAEPAAEAGAGPKTVPFESPGPPPPPPPAPPRAPWWPLSRSVRDRKVKGVAGGLAAAADLDPTLVRLLFVVAAFSGWGIVAYIALAVVLQDETADHPARPLAREPRRNLRIGLGIAAVVAAGRLFDGWFFGSRDMGLPLLLIAAGAAVLWARRDQGSGPPPPPPAAENPLPGPAEPASWAATPPPPPLGAGIDWRSTGLDLLRLAGAFVAVGALLALLGGAFLVVVGAVPMRLPLLPAAVAVAGLLGLVVAVVRRGRFAALLVSGGVLLAAVALAAGLASFPDGSGTRIVVVGPDAPLQRRYEHGAGRLVLDLRSLSLAPEEQRRVVAKVGAGDLTVIVPTAVATDARGQAGAGNVTLFGRHESGPGIDVSGRHPGAEGGGRLDLDLDVGVGQITVELAPEPTFDVSCRVPEEARGDGTDVVTCPHPVPLTGKPMTCSVALADPGSSAAGQAYCRPLGGAVPKIGHFAVTCDVPAGSDEARCSRLGAAAVKELADLRISRAAPTAPPPPAPPAGGAPLTCGPPDAAGERTCATVPPSTTSTTAPASYRCREDPATRQLSCVPG